MPDASVSPDVGLRVADAGQLGMAHGAWEIFQQPRFAEIYARHFGSEVVEHHGVLVFTRRVPGLGLLRAQVYSPEAGAGADWHRILSDLPTGRVEVMTNAPAPADLEALVSPSDLHSFILDLRPSPDTLFAGFAPTTRKSIRRAEREGMVVRLGQDARDLARFHEVLLRVTRGGVVYAAPDLALLQAIMRGGFGRVYLLLLGQAVVGGAFQLVNRHSHGYVAAFDRQACHGLPGQLLYWGVMQGEIQAGMPFNDMGAQSLSGHSGLTAAKRGFSPVLVPAYRYEVTRSRWRAAVYSGLRWMNRTKEQPSPAPTEAMG